MRPAEEGTGLGLGDLVVSYCCYAVVIDAEVHLSFNCLEDGLDTFGFLLFRKFPFDFCGLLVLSVDFVFVTDGVDTFDLD